MVKKLLKCFLCLLLLDAIVCGLGGIWIGYKLGTSNVCEQATYYHGKDTKLLPCSKLKIRGYHHD